MFQFRKWRREFGIRKRNRLANTTVPLQRGNLVKPRYLLHDPASRVVNSGTGYRGKLVRWLRRLHLIVGRNLEQRRIWLCPAQVLDLRRGVASRVRGLA